MNEHRLSLRDDYFINRFLLVLFPELAHLLDEKVLSKSQLIEILHDPFSVKEKSAFLYANAWLNKRIKARKGSFQLGVVPAGGTTQKWLHQLAPLPKKSVTLFDSFPEKSQSRFESPVFPVHSLSQHPWDRLVIMSGANADALLDKIAGHVSLRRNHLYCPFYSILPAEERNRSIIDRMNRLIDATDKPSMVFVCTQFQAPFFKRMLALKETGIRTLLITLIAGVSNSMSLGTVQDAFNLVYCAEGNLLDFLYIIKHLRPSRFHLLSLVNSALIPLLAAAVMQRPYVLEFNDLLITIFNEKMLVDAIGSHTAKLQWNAERYLLAHSQGVVHKNRTDAMEYLFSFYGIARPHLTFFSYPLNDTQPTTRKTSKTIRFVWAGGIHAHTPLSNPQTKITAIVEEVTHQGFGFAVFNAYDPGNREDYQQFRQQAESNPLFEYYPAVSPALLTEKLSEYDMGWFVDDYSHYPFQRYYFETTAASRFFEYLEAGLPIIIMPDLAFMADMVKKHSLGLLLSYSELSNLKKYCSREKIDRYKTNVIAYRRSILMRNQIHRLTAFIF
jgi:hypothetical protein